MPASQRVVGHLLDGTLIKGFTEWDSTEVSVTPPKDAPERLVVAKQDGSGIVELPVDKLKAIFFVKTFEGSRDYREVKFFTAHPRVDGLWVRVQFQDHERTEGIIYNSIQFVRDGGFFMKPPDPNSNNSLVFVSKQALREFRVLGVRGTF